MFRGERARLPDSICHKIVPGNSLSGLGSNSGTLANKQDFCPFRTLDTVTAETYRLLVRCIGFWAGVLAFQQRDGGRLDRAARKRKRKHSQSVPPRRQQLRGTQGDTYGHVNPQTRTQRALRPRQLKCIAFFSKD